MDWGLLKVLGKERVPDSAVQPQPTSTTAVVRSGSDNTSTQAGAIMGTPRFMAPEQARGEVEGLDERCDVFGLGAILCVLLTGQPPFTQPSSLEALVQTAAGDLTGVYCRLDTCGADLELTALAKRCLAPLVAERP